MHVLPSGLNLTQKAPPTVASAGNNGDGTATVTGTNWAPDTQIYFDGLPATVAFLDADGPPHFAIVLPETNEQGATLAADKIRRGIASHDFSTGGNWQRITVSCGAATIGLMPPTDEEAGLMNRREYTGNLLREAYHALEAGRSAGTNRTSVGAFHS